MSHPAPTACAALAPVAWNARNTMKSPTFFDNAQPTVDIKYSNVASKYIARLPCLSDNDAQSNGYSINEGAQYMIHSFLHTSYLNLTAKPIVKT